MKLRARADEPKTTLSLLDRFKPELVAVEPPRSVKVPGRKLGHGMGVAQWSGHGHRLLVGGLDECVDRRSRQESSRHPLLHMEVGLSRGSVGRPSSGGKVAVGWGDVVPGCRGDGAA